MENSRTYKIIIIAPTCFYYQVPLFRALDANDRIDLTVFFCTDEGSSGKDVNLAYGSDENWTSKDDLLSGYKYRFLKNHIPGGSYMKSLIGLGNLGIWDELSRERPDALVITSWMNPTWWLAFLACLKLDIPLLFMTDANVLSEKTLNPLKFWIKQTVLGSIVFPVAKGFLCAGTANRQLYQLYHVPDEKLFPFAYSWGYDSLLEESKRIKGQKAALRSRYGIPQDAVVILYCGRLSLEKGCLDLLNAFEMVSNPEKALVLVGDGPLKKQMQTIADDRGIKSVYHMGFKNRETIGQFYALADIFVLPSHKETWGIVVNEALCFSLPIIASDQVGAALDLMIPEENGYLFPANDTSKLADQITRMIDLPDEDRLKMGQKSWNLISHWLDRDLSVLLCENLDSIYQAHS